MDVPVRLSLLTFVALAMILVLGVVHTPASAASTHAPRAVGTFESIGLYWDPGVAGQENLITGVQYRVKGSGGAWNEGLALWYDGRQLDGEPAEFRGSIVGLTPDTAYEIRLTLSNGVAASLVARTMSEHFPVGMTVYLPKSSSAQLVITTGGTPSAYTLYTFDPAAGSAVIDVQHRAPTCVTVAAPYVIIRGLVCRGAMRHGIDLHSGAHHVVIEGNDISDWGSERAPGTGLGVNNDSGIHAAYLVRSITDIVIQRNRIHDPTFTANSWDTGHPAGPQGITFEQDGGGHNIIRYNEITGSAKHAFEDGIGGGENYSYGGAMGRDSDIYGNLVTYAYDDGIEVEGGGMNVRVWGNYLDRTGTGIASAVTSLGPLYVYRNVYNRSRFLFTQPLDKDDRGGFAKVGDDKSNPAMGGGRRYYFHNTCLQMPPPSQDPIDPTLRPQYGLGAGQGIYDAGGPLTNTVSRNNIWDIWKPSWQSIGDNHEPPSSTNDFDYDLYNGRIAAYAGAEAHGIYGVPVYAQNNGWSSGSGGEYALAEGSPGYHAAVKLPNFNDAFAHPDMGAHQSGTPPMQFGVHAYSGPST